MYANRARRCPSGAKDLGMQKNEKHTAQIAAPECPPAPPEDFGNRKERKMNC